MNDKSLREHLLYLLRGGGAHISFEKLVADFPTEMMNHRVEHIPYTAWQVVEHMRIAQWDILEFVRHPEHVSPEFSAGYWADDSIVPDKQRWGETIRAFCADLKEIERIVEDSATDLFAPLPHGEGQTLLREVLLVADHTAYHLGVLSTLKRLLGAANE